MELKNETLGPNETSPQKLRLSPERRGRRGASRAGRCRRAEEGERQPTVRDGTKQAVLAREAERQLRGLQRVPAREAETQLRGLQGLPA